MKYSWPQRISTINSDETEKELLELKLSDRARLYSASTCEAEPQIAQEQAIIARQTAFDAMEASNELGTLMQYPCTLHGVDRFFIME